MKVIKLLIATVIVLTGLTTKVFAQGEAAVPFLLLAPDSRAGGIGESGVALGDNANAIFWNPAGIAFLDGSEVSFTHSNWLPQFGLDLFYEYAAYRQYMPSLNGSIFASIT
jgi:long-subunit fatty acid transport protein